ncbi:hypothetical protein Vretimale_16955 [Volvox reticuliferus]|uniref:Uncharacterized protein n=1 Tax=Volvox reticuliferus TaxID=1737510 RepID=A0A8J4GVA2_9CHLO|nr:hypothetical protein Vretimale_16955 [Volvox reticuliferus]
MFDSVTPYRTPSARRARLCAGSMTSRQSKTPLHYHASWASPMLSPAPVLRLARGSTVCNLCQCPMGELNPSVLRHDVSIPSQNPLGGQQPLHPHRPAGVDAAGADAHLHGDVRTTRRSRQHKQHNDFGFRASQPDKWTRNDSEAVEGQSLGLHSTSQQNRQQAAVITKAMAPLSP